MRYWPVIGALKNSDSLRPSASLVPDGDQVAERVVELDFDATAVLVNWPP